MKFDVSLVNATLPFAFFLRMASATELDIMQWKCNEFVQPRTSGTKHDFGNRICS